MAPKTRARPRRSQQERSQTTTRQLIEAARELFAKSGYQDASLSAIVRACKMTKGALYHQFANGKVELFEAVFRAEQERLREAFERAYAAKRDPVAGVHAGLSALLNESLEPGVQRITLVDAPSVFGYERMRQLEETYGIAAISDALRQAIKAGRIRRRDVETVAYLLYGAVTQGALFAARSNDEQAAARKVERELKVLLESLQA